MRTICLQIQTLSECSVETSSRHYSVSVLYLPSYLSFSKINVRNAPTLVYNTAPNEVLDPPGQPIRVAVL